MIYLYVYGYKYNFRLVYSMNNDGNNSEDLESRLFKSKDVEVVPFNTDLLITTYEEQFDKICFSDGTICYTERPTPENKGRRNRYIAKRYQDDGKEQDLYSLESSNIWEQSFTDDDYAKIVEAGEDIKFQVTDGTKESALRKKTIILSNGQAVRVELVPYSTNSSERIMNDLENKQITR